MTMVTVEDVLADASLRDAVSEDLIAALESGLVRAKQEHQSSRERRDGYTLVVSDHGDIDVEIDSFHGFDSWVDDAQDLALHVGPSTDPNTGAHVYELLGRDADGELQEPGSESPPPAHDPEFTTRSGDGPSWAAGLPPLHWPGWSPRMAGSETAEATSDLTVEVQRIAWAWRCDGCGAASIDADDFESIDGDVRHRSCDCGGQAERTPAVLCESCDTLILLSSTDPDAHRNP